MSPLRPQSRTVTLVYGVVALVILLVIAAVALVISPPAPPSVAEFAPQAAETIEESPDNQSSQFGAGSGACAEGQVCDGATTTTEADGGGNGAGGGRRTVDVERVRRCVGDPPRQTEDPQSPPCVNYFEGDNGGVTAPGVTRDEIRIAVRNTTTFPDLAKFQAFAAHFNNRYELYGRKLRFVPYSSDQDYKAAAADIAATGAFAAVSPNYDGFADSDEGFTRETARRRIVSVSAHADIAYADHDYRAMGPYAWTFVPPGVTLQRSVADLVCSSLAGRQARFAGPAYQLTTRKFGIVVERNKGRGALIGALHDGLARCGVTARVYEISGTQSDVQTMQLMQADNVTSVLALAFVTRISNEMGAANKVGYQPEWIVSGVGETENELSWTVAPPEQRAHLFGIGPFNKILPPSDEPAAWALRESNPDANVLASRAVVAQYQSLLLLASGIQLAGPRLTPQSFAAGLQKARFPNPGHGAAPYYQAHVGFAPGDFAMADDVAVVWFNDAAPGYRNPTGTGGWCYVGRGRRFVPGDIPDVESALFNPDPGACR